MEKQTSLVFASHCLMTLKRIGTLSSQSAIVSGSESSGTIMTRVIIVFAVWKSCWAEHEQQYLLYQTKKKRTTQVLALFLICRVAFSAFITQNTEMDIVTDSPCLYWYLDTCKKPTTNITRIHSGMIPIQLRKCELRAPLCMPEFATFVKSDVSCFLKVNEPFY